MAHAMIQPLESRTLMSASPVLAADRAAVRADLTKFRADALAGTASLLQAASLFKGAHLATDAVVGPALAKLRADVKATQLTLKGDRLTESQAVLGDEQEVVTELKQLLADRGHATATAADHAALKADYAKLQADAVAGIDSRIGTRTAATTTIFADVAALGAAVDADPAVTPAVKAALVRFGTAREAKLTVLTADLAKLAADRTTLATDLSAAAAAA